MKIEKQLDENIGLNNKRVWPTRMPVNPTRGPPYMEIEEPTITEKIAELSKSVKTQMNEEKFAELTRDPENQTGHSFLREKYQLP